MSDIVVSTFINEPSIKYLLDYYIQQAKIASEFSNAIAFIDSISVVVWTLTAGALSLTGIIGAFAALGYQTQLEDIRSVYEAFFNLKKFNDPSIPFDPSEGAVKKRSGDIRRNFAAYQFRYNSINESNILLRERWWLLLVPTSLLWLIGLGLLIFRWTQYSVGNFNLLYILISTTISLLILVLIIFTLKYYIDKMKKLGESLDSIDKLLNVGINNEIDSLQHLLDTAGVYVVLEGIREPATLRFNVFYAVPFHNFILKPEIYFYDNLGNETGKLPSPDHELKINHGYDESKSLVDGDKDEFYAQTIDNSVEFRIRLKYECTSTTKIEPTLFSFERIKIESLKDGRYHFIACGHSWGIPQNKLNFWMGGKKYILNADGTVNDNGTEFD